MEDKSSTFQAWTDAKRADPEDSYKDQQGEFLLLFIKDHQNNGDLTNIQPPRNPVILVHLFLIP